MFASHRELFGIAWPTCKRGWIRGFLKCGGANNMSVTDSELLTPAESRLNDLEAIITTGKRSFIEVGNALSEIQANGLYEAKYKTFAKYCEQRWGFSRQYAYWMIQGCDAKKSLPEHVTTYVDSPTKAAAAAKVPIEKRSETVLAAQAKADAEGRKMRAQDITDAATVDAESTVIESKPLTPTDTAPAPESAPAEPRVWPEAEFKKTVTIILTEYQHEGGAVELTRSAQFLRDWAKSIEKHAKWLTAQGVKI